MATPIVSILILLSAATAQKHGNLAVGIVEVPDGVSIVVIDNSGVQVKIQEGPGGAQLPVGQYRIESWTTERRDKDGSTWRLTGSTFGKRGMFSVIEDRPVKLSAGEPLLPTLTARKTGSTYQLTLRLTGRLGETIAITRNGSLPDAPKLRVTHADGSYRETLAFEYG